MRLRRTLLHGAVIPTEGLRFSGGSRRGTQHAICDVTQYCTCAQYAVRTL